MNKKEQIKLLGMEWPYFIGLLVLVVLAMYFNFLPGSLAGQIPLLLVFGEGLPSLGDAIPIVEDYLVGGSGVGLCVRASLVG